jgi:hypothetical protein
MFAQIKISQRLAIVFKTRQHVPTVREPRKRIAALFQTGQDNMVIPARDKQFVAGIEKKQIELSLVQRPVAHRSRVNVKKPRARIPTNSPVPHCPCRLHRPFVSGFEANVESAPVNVLAVFSDTKVGTRQFCIGFACAIGREYRRSRLPDRVHNARQKIEHPDVDRRFSPEW